MTAREGRAPLARRVAIYGAAGLAAIAGVAIWNSTVSHRGADATHASADTAVPGGANAA
ncbi:lipase chaperone, partial [Burkholderia territorii]